LVDGSPAASEHAASGGWPLPVTHCVVHRIAGGRIAEWRFYIDGEPGDRASDADLLAGIHRLIGEQAALRRVATLVARGAAQSKVFDAIVSETVQLLGEETWLVRFEADGTATIVAQHGAAAGRDRIAHLVPSEGGILASVQRSGRPARIDGDVGRSGPGLAQRGGVVASAAAPLIVEGTPWGALVLVSRAAPLAAGIEDRLAQFADLAATAIANAQSRAELQLLADEQVALLRVAELVAHGAATQEVFDQVTVEASRLLDDTPTALWRYESSGTAAVEVAQSPAAQLGARFPVVGEISVARVWRTGSVVRIDDYDGVAGADGLPRWIRASVSAPVVVERRLWGVLIARSPGPPLPAGTEERLARFCELVAAAIANAESRAALAASRARIVAGADEARRRLVRDVHDGAQQRLVHTLITLKQARSVLTDADSEAGKLLDESLAQAQSANGAPRRGAGSGVGGLARGTIRAGPTPQARRRYQDERRWLSRCTGRRRRRVSLARGRHVARDGT
jgi:GAF domain-containing protein